MNKRGSNSIENQNKKLKFSNSNSHESNSPRDNEFFDDEDDMYIMSASQVAECSSQNNFNVSTINFHGSSTSTQISSICSNNEPGNALLNDEEDGIFTIIEDFKVPAVPPRPHLNASVKSTVMGNRQKEKALEAKINFLTNKLAETIDDKNKLEKHHEKSLEKERSNQSEINILRSANKNLKKSYDSVCSEKIKEMENIRNDSMQKYGDVKKKLELTEIELQLKNVELLKLKSQRPQRSQPIVQQQLQHKEVSQERINIGSTDVLVRKRKYRIKYVIFEVVFFDLFILQNIKNV